MKIITFQPKLFRWEYEVVDALWTHAIKRRWFLFHEDISEHIRIRSVAEAAEYLTDQNHPAWNALLNIMKFSRDEVELLPWQPFESAELVQTHSPYAIEKIEGMNKEFRVLCHISKRIWLHVPGDAAIDHRVKPV